MFVAAGFVIYQQGSLFSTLRGDVGGTASTSSEMPSEPSSSPEAISSDGVYSSSPSFPSSDPSSTASFPSSESYSSAYTSGASTSSLISSVYVSSKISSSSRQSCSEPAYYPPSCENENEPATLGECEPGYHAVDTGCIDGSCFCQDSKRGGHVKCDHTSICVQDE